MYDAEDIEKVTQAAGLALCCLIWAALFVVGGAL